MKRNESYLLHILRAYVMGFAGVQKMISSLGFNNAECINLLYQVREIHPTDLQPCQNTKHV
ncbi:hypothetical protein NST28_19115 [Paenibacillus sp. FSL R10-2791]|uniref:hypothetical protein n=1 Tax=Paenibacillus TaxID=44249 RepID=UPI001C54E411|nr:hypothetical protein [Paenibacillus odorifer]